MPFIDQSIVTTKTLSDLQNTKTTNATTTVNQPTTTVVSSGSTILDAIKNVESKQTDFSNKLTSIIKSNFGTFNNSLGSLASGISSNFGGLFANTNNKSASDVTTKLSDPVQTNLIDTKKSTATAFRVDSLSFNSKAVNDRNATTTTGSNYVQMAGTSLTTMLNRLKLDIASVSSIPSLLTSKFSKASLSRLVTTTAIGAGNLVGNNFSDPLLKGLVGSGTTSAVASLIGVNTTTGLNSGYSSDLAGFLGTTNSISTNLGGIDLSSYYRSDEQSAIIDSNGNYINTNGTAIDASTANSIVGLVSSIGCSLTTQQYYSANQNASLFGLGILLAALKGLEELVNDLKNCRYASTLTGQKSLGEAFTQSAGTQLNTSLSVISAIDNPTELYSADLSRNILQNDDLDASDVGTLDAIFTYLGTSSDQELQISQASSSSYKVYDETLLADVNASVVSQITKSNTLVDTINGYPLSMTNSGYLALV